MKLEDQVCSLELAKRLKELGVRQESAFYWTPSDENGLFSLHQLKWSKHYSIVCDHRFLAKKTKNHSRVYSAFTVAELGEMLPTRIVSWRWDELECCGDNRRGYSATYQLHNTDTKHTEQADTEADARAKMLIYLIENNIVKTDK